MTWLLDIAATLDRTSTNTKILYGGFGTLRRSIAFLLEAVDTLGPRPQIIDIRKAPYLEPRIAQP